MTVFADASDRCPQFSKVGFEYRHSPMRRHVGLFSLIWDFSKTVVTICKGRPDVLHAVTVKPILIIGVVARVFKIPFIASISGLGPAFSAKGLLGRLRRFMVIAVYRFIFGSKNCAVIVQTQHDREVLLSSSICRESQLVLVPGSGVKIGDYLDEKNAEKGKFRSENDKKIRVLMAARMLSDKGVIEFLRTAAVLARENEDTEWLLAGPFDKESPTCLSEEFVLNECGSAGVRYLGNVENMPELLKSISLFVYPSYYPEGLPKILLEVAAAGVPVVTTDHPGCRDAIVEGYSGVLARPKDVADLTRVTRCLLLDGQTRRRMRQFASTYAQEHYDISAVVDQHFKLYDHVLRDKVRQ